MCVRYCLTLKHLRLNTNSSPPVRCHDIKEQAQYRAREDCPLPFTTVQYFLHQGLALDGRTMRREAQEVAANQEDGGTTERRQLGGTPQDFIFSISYHNRQANSINVRPPPFQTFRSGERTAIEAAATVILDSLPRLPSPETSRTVPMLGHLRKGSAHSSSLACHPVAENDLVYHLSALNASISGKLELPRVVQ